MATVTIDMNSGLYPPEAADAFLGNHVFVADDGGEGRKLQGVVVAAEYVDDTDSIRLTVEATDVPGQTALRFRLTRRASPDTPTPEGVERVTGIGYTDPVPDRFPFLLDDDELDAVLLDMIRAIPGFDQYRALLPELKLNLVLIGSQERSRRESDRFARRSLWVALIALAVSMATLAASIVLAIWPP